MRMNNLIQTSDNGGESHMEMNHEELTVLNDDHEEEKDEDEKENVNELDDDTIDNDQFNYNNELSS